MNKSTKITPDKYKVDLSTVNISNIFVTKIGHMQDQPNQFFTNYFVRHDFCIQYVTAGKGEYFVNNKLYKLRKNTLFLLPKDKYHYYKSDPNDPYEYYWIHFNGAGFENFLKIIKLTEDSPVLFDVVNNNIEKCFIDLIEICKSKSGLQRNLSIMSKSYELLFEIASSAELIELPELKSNNPIIEQVVNYIVEHYTEKITLETLSNLVHINKCYLANLFKKITGLSPIQYLIQYRVSCACQLLNTDMTVTEICYACGFSELTNFLIRFKQHTGSTPMQYRKALPYMENNKEKEPK